MAIFLILFGTLIELAQGKAIVLSGRVSAREKIMDSHFKVFYGGPGKAGFHPLEIQMDFGYEYILFTSALVSPEGVYCEKKYFCETQDVQYIVDNNSPNLI